MFVTQYQPVRNDIQCYPGVGVIDNMSCTKVCTMLRETSNNMYMFYNMFTDCNTAIKALMLIVKSLLTNVSITRLTFRKATPV